MPWRKELTEKKKVTVSAFHNQNLSSRATAKRIKRITDVFLNYIKSGEQYGGRKRSYRSSKMSSQDKRLLLGEISKGQSSE